MRSMLAITPHRLAMARKGRRSAHVTPQNAGAAAFTCPSAARNGASATSTIHDENAIVMNALNEKSCRRGTGVTMSHDTSLLKNIVENDVMRLDSTTMENAVTNTSVSSLLTSSGPMIATPLR